MCVYIFFLDHIFVISGGSLTSENFIEHLSGRIYTLNLFLLFSFDLRNFFFKPSLLITFHIHLLSVSFTGFSLGFTGSIFLFNVHISPLSLSNEGTFLIRGRCMSIILEQKIEGGLNREIYNLIKMILLYVRLRPLIPFFHLKNIRSKG